MMGGMEHVWTGVNLNEFEGPYILSLSLSLYIYIFRRIDNCGPICGWPMAMEFLLEPHDLHVPVFSSHEVNTLLTDVSTR